MSRPFHFASFLMGGFEACFARNEHGARIDMLRSTRHDEYCREDYRLLKDTGIFTVRESLSWHQIDRGNGQYDFSRFERIMQTAREEGMQVIWSLNHFDIPDDTDPFSPAFVERFTSYALEAARTIRRYTEGTMYLIPINEISFFSWFAAEIGVWAPYAHNRGFEFKVQLTRCVIDFIRRLRLTDPDVRFVHADPYMHRFCLPDADHATRQFVHDFNENDLFQAWDIVSGRMMPELGGQPDFLDVVGIHYYVYNQELVREAKPDPAHPLPRFKFKALELDDPLRMNFDEILKVVYDRYRKPLAITETGSFGILRVPWWERIFRETDRAIEQGIPVLGICSYPVIDRPDWHDGHLTNSGFWDFEAGDATCRRIPHEGVLQVVRQYTGERKSDPA